MTRPRSSRQHYVGIFALAIATAGLEMIEPLFIRFITGRVLLDTAAATPIGCGC